jgi:predicted metal-dependent enzyme (double-stranded beta helix superfamily)
MSDAGAEKVFKQIIDAAEEVACGKQSKEFLAKILKQFAENKTPIDQFVEYSEESYTRNQIYVSDRVEVVLTCWDKKQESEPHDHGGSWGIVVAYQGNIVNHMYKRVSGDCVEEIDTIIQGPGDVLVMDVEDIHKVESDASTHSCHVSLHCYFPPVPKMNEYKPKSKVSGG